MGVDEAGEQGAVAELDDAGLFPPPREDRAARPRRGDDAVPNRHRLDGGLFRIHRDDVIADEDRVGDLGRRKRGKARCERNGSEDRA